MAKQLPITVEGTVIETLGNALFKVELSTGHEIIAHPSGKMRMHMINIVTGDNVTCEMSVYDLRHGRIVRRIIPNN